MNGSSVPVGLSVAGMSYTFRLNPGFGRTASTAREVMDYARDLGLSGVEVPARMLDRQHSDGDVEAVGAYAADNGLFVVVDTNGFDPDELARVIDLAKRIGAHTVRTVIGGAKIGGDRRPLAGTWQPFMDEVHKSLALATQAAERVNVTLAVENHQDLASEELLWLCESIDSSCFGITLDTGNPLATAEEPLDFVRRVAPYVNNVHLKDYWSWHSDEGYLLVRCPLGHGLTDFPAMLDMLDEQGNNPTKVIELAALEARHIRVFAPDFWPDYPPRTSAQLAAALRVVNLHAKPSGDWRTPFERGESADAVAAYEQHQLTQSIGYVRALHAARRQRLP